MGINAGGALIPIFLSIYLTIRKKIPLKMICIGVIIVSIITYLVTRVDVSKKQLKVKVTKLGGEVVDEIVVR